MKKLLTFLILGFIIILTGCAGVDYSIFQMPDGSILEVFSCADNPSYFLSAGATAEQVGKFREEGLVMLARQASLSESEYNLKLQNKILSGDVSDIELLTNGLKVEAGTDDSGNIILRYKYKNKTAYDFFNDIVINTDKQKMQVNKHFFTSDYILLNTTTKYAKLVVDGEDVITLGKKIYKEFDALVKKAMGEEVLQKLNKPKLNYVYLTNSSRLHSDSDFTYKVGAITAHVWQIDELTTERKITLYRTEARSGVWYSIALGGALIIVVASLIYNKIKKTKSSQ